jgi:hypothetical protein
MFDADGKLLVRNLYVPYKEEYAEDHGEIRWTTTISWDAQRDAGHKLFALGYDVRLHRHGWGGQCIGNDGPNGACVTFELTPEGETRIVPLVRDEEIAKDTTPVA